MEGEADFFGQQRLHFQPFVVPARLPPAIAPHRNLENLEHWLRRCPCPAIWTKQEIDFHPLLSLRVQYKEGVHWPTLRDGRELRKRTPPLPRKFLLFLVDGGLLFWSVALSKLYDDCIGRFPVGLTNP